jgi:ATP-dependent RNA helicase RhlE
MDYVINYDLPDDPENYVHRCGRTGRGTNKGQALSFCSQGERDLLTAIEEYTGEEIEHYEIDREDYDSILNDSDDPTYDWKKLIDKVNKEDGKEDVW